MPRSLVLSGGGACADPWHPFAKTSARLAHVLWSLGHQVEVTDFVADRVADLSGFDLIVVNAAGGPGGPPAALKGPRAGLRAALDRGMSVLAVHTGVCTLLRLPEWEAVTGAAWVEGRSGHPKLGPAHVQIHPDRHPVVAGLADFDLVDERTSVSGWRPAWCRWLRTGTADASTRWCGPGRSAGPGWWPTRSATTCRRMSRPPTASCWPRP
jgi:uncharacterized protein